VPWTCPGLPGMAYDVGMRKRIVLYLAGCALLTCSLQAPAAGPGPGCSNAAECGCLRGSPSACELLAAQNPALAQEAQAARAAYEAAASGGRNSGFLRNVLNQKWGPRQIRKSIKSLGEHATRHEGYLKDPTGKVSNWAKLTPRHQQDILSGWEAEIVTAREQIGILRIVLMSL